jgi:hypothetical protein
VMAWVLRRAEKGNNRVLWLLKAIRRAWNLLPQRWRTPCESLGRALQLDWQMMPALVAVLVYPFLDRVGDRIGPWWALVIIYLPLILWGHAVAGSLIGIGHQTLAATVFLVILFVAAVPLAYFAESWWSRIGEDSGYAFRLGFFGLLIAATVFALTIDLDKQDHILHLVRVVAAGTGFATMVFLSIFVGALPGWAVVDTPSRLFAVEGWRTLLVDAGLCAVIGAVVFLALARRSPGRFLRRASLRVAPAATAIVWILPTLFAFTAAISLVEESFSAYVGPEFTRGAQPATAPGALGSAELAEQYRPLLVVAREERWIAARVDGYLADATVKRLGSATAQTGIPLPRSCASPTHENTRPIPICFALSAGCEDVRRSCDKGHTGKWPRHKLQRGVVYARVVIRGNPASDGSPDPFRPPLPFRDLYALVQYWIFFRNDLWSTSTLLGQLLQRHEADWEMVMVGLSKAKPLFVAFSAHCAGSWRSWNDTATISMADGSVRPVAWVARGSHAMYPDTSPPVPDFTSCRKGEKGKSTRARDSLSLLAYSANVRETLPDVFVAQDPDWQSANARTQPFSFPGRWSINDRLLIKNGFREAVLPPEGRAKETTASGPETPSCKKIWADPLAIIFCNEHWGDQSRCNAKLERRLDDLRAAPSTCI